MRRRPNPQKAVDAFNSRFKIGDEIVYHEVIGDGKPQRLRTRTEAQVLSGHSPVVWLEGKCGCVHVTHCFPPPLELALNRTYRAKKPAPAGNGVVPYYNDRSIVYLDDKIVQYDGPSVAIGRHLPKVSRDTFLDWADRDVTDQLPTGEYQRWDR